MDGLKSLSDSLAALTATASAKVFHVPSSLGGRTALGFDGKHLLVCASDAAIGESLTILASGGAETQATVAGFDPGRGLAVLELGTPLNESAWKIAREKPALGSLVLAVAYPSPEGPEVRLDVLRFSGGEGEASYLQTDGSPFPGFTGAALVNMEGELVGFQLSERGGNQGWALPASRAAELVDAVLSGKASERAWLGVSTVPIAVPEEFAGSFADGQETALLISGVQAGSPAAKAGLRVGDILVSLGGTPLVGGEDLIAVLKKSTPGSELPLVVLRSGTRMEFVAVTEARSDEGSRHHRYGAGRGFGLGRGFGFGHRWMEGGCGWDPGR